MNARPDQSLRLGVNVDHVATLRQARGTRYPSPLAAAFIAQSSGADSITAHLREDRRHIQEQDLRELRQALGIPLNLELALDERIIRLAEELQPQACCFVPERRDELTTEGGLDVVAHQQPLAEACARLVARGCRVSFFIEADARQLDAAVACGVQAVEFHTGRYANLQDPAELAAEQQRIAQLAAAARGQGLEAHAGHGLHVENVGAIARIGDIVELNIGHSLVADAVLMGMAAAVARMKAIMMNARRLPAVKAAL